MYIPRLAIYNAKTLSRYFSHTFPDPSLAAGASARPARLSNTVLLAATAY